MALRKKRIKLRTLALALLVGGGLVFTSLSLFLLSGRPSKSVAHDESSSRAVSSKKHNSKGDQGARKPQSKEARAAQTGEGSGGPPKVAVEMKVPVASRGVFLDHELSQEAMKVQWDRLLAMALQQGHAVLIAHPHRETLVFLREHLRDLRSEVRLVRVADIVS
jgi:hypothetical protein